MCVGGWGGVVPAVPFPSFKLQSNFRSRFKNLESKKCSRTHDCNCFKFLETTAEVFTFASEERGLVWNS